MAGREEEFGFTITPRKSIRHPVEVLADLDFVDNIALLSYTIEQAQLLHRVESECKKVVFGLDGHKTKSVAYNTSRQCRTKMEGWLQIPRVLMDSSENISVGKTRALRALNGMTRVWSSKTEPNLTNMFFITTVESFLLYGSESWTMSEMQEKSLNGPYTRMSTGPVTRQTSSYMARFELLKDKVASGHHQVAGHCHCHLELDTRKLVLWELTHGHRGRGRPRTRFIDTL